MCPLVSSTTGVAVILWSQGDVSVEVLPLPCPRDRGGQSKRGLMVRVGVVPQHLDSPGRCQLSSLSWPSPGDATLGSSRRRGAGDLRQHFGKANAMPGPVLRLGDLLASPGSSWDTRLPRCCWLGSGSLSCRGGFQTTGLSSSINHTNDLADGRWPGGGWWGHLSPPSLSPAAIPQGIIKTIKMGNVNSAGGCFPPEGFPSSSFAAASVAELGRVSLIALLWGLGSWPVSSCPPSGAGSQPAPQAVGRGICPQQIPGGS